MTVNMAMRNPDDGSIATNAKENIEIFGKHFSNTLDTSRDTDESFLDSIQIRSKMKSINNPITFKEVNTAINKQKKGKAPGLNGLPPEALKAMGAPL